MPKRKPFKVNLFLTTDLNNDDWIKVPSDVAYSEGIRLEEAKDKILAEAAETPLAARLREDRDFEEKRNRKRK